MAMLEVEEFAELLITCVRDSAIRSCDLLRDPECNSVDAKRLRERFESGQIDQFVAEIITDCVDDTIFHLLNAVDHGVMKLSYTSASGKTIDLTEGGMSEMSGWYMNGVDGWRTKYSKERLNEDVP